MSVSEWLDGFQQRHPAAGFPLAVIYKFVDDQGAYLAALVTYYAFVSLFPLLLLLTTILGFILHGNPDLQKQIVNSTLSQFPVIGDQIGSPKGLSGSGIGLVVGILGSLYGGLGVAQAAQNAMNVAWGVPRNERPNPLKARARRPAAPAHRRAGHPGDDGAVRAHGQRRLFRGAGRFRAPSPDHRRIRDHQRRHLPAGLPGGNGT